VESSAEKEHDREIPLPPSTLAIIRAMPARIDCEWLFPTPTGKLWRYSNWHRKVWQPTIESANDPRRSRARRLDPTPHDFRHSWNTHLRAAGIDPADLADVAGHSVQTATAHYTHALRKSFDEIRRVVG
jgi:integrase